MIRIKNLSKSYRYDDTHIIKAVDDVSLEIKKGEIFGLLGPNGAGKTTLIRSILGLLNYHGEIELFGNKILFKDSRYKKNIGYIPGELGIPKDITGKQLIDYLIKLYSLDIDRKYIEEVAGRLQIDLHRKMGALSKGNKQKIGILSFLLYDFEILILDEPTSGLDPIVKKEIRKLIKEKQEKTNCTIIYCSHILSEVETLCDRVAIIKSGKIIEISDISKLKSKALKHFTLIFEGLTLKKVNEIYTKLANKFPNVEKDELDNKKLTFLVPFNEQVVIVKEIMNNPQVKEKLISIKIIRSSLESIFLKYYKDNEELSERLQAKPKPKLSFLEKLNKMDELKEKQKEKQKQKQKNTKYKDTDKESESINPKHLMATIKYILLQSKYSFLMFSTIIFAMTFVSIIIFNETFLTVTMNFPVYLTNIMGGSFDVTTVEGMFHAKVLGNWYFFWGIYITLRSVNIMALDIEERSIDLYLSKPISRKEYFYSKQITLIIYDFMLGISGFLIFVVSCLLNSYVKISEVPLGQMFMAFIWLSIELIALGSLCVMISCFVERKTARSYSLIYFILSFMILMLFLQESGAIKYFGIFQYYLPNGLIFDNNWKGVGRDISILLLIAVISTYIGLKTYQQRDIYV